MREAERHAEDGFVREGTLKGRERLSWPAGFFLKSVRGGEGHSSPGLVGSVKEMRAGDGMVLLASVCKK